MLAKHYKGYSHFCSKNINVHVFENTLATAVNKFVINKLVKLALLWTTGPRCHFLLPFWGDHLHEMSYCMSWEKIICSPRVCQESLKVLALDKECFFQPKIDDISYFSTKTYPGHSLEVPREGALMSALNICICGEIRKMFSSFPSYLKLCSEFKHMPVVTVYVLCSLIMAFMKAGMINRIID